MERPLYIAFVWHMHQPYYKDLVTGEISMPWVRLHGIKDYLNMVEMLKDFPKIRQTFNLVPSLIDQIEDYTKDKLPNDKFLNLSLKPAADLTPEDKKFILLNFFMANWDTMIAPLPRFRELLLKRGRFVSPSIIDRVVPGFKPQDYLDLQILFNLAWFDPTFSDTDKDLSELKKKGSKFSESDKGIILKKQIEILKKIIPTYKELQDRSQIEIAVSPYYHPILPLIYNTDTARIGMPRERMPQKQFSHPEDARWQVENAVKRYREVFGRAPEGMWPSEGSVSEDILPILIENNIKWIATDEEILLRSSHAPRTAELLYRPYLLARDAGSINIIFRDHNLSDLLGFTYQGAPAEAAADDFVTHLHRIREAVASKQGNFLVSIVLDGENAWEYYPNNARDFLNALYYRLSKEEHTLKTTTVSDYLKNNPPRTQLAHLYPGSWINGDYSIWIGQEEKNTSWDYLSAVRDDLAHFQETNKKSVEPEKIAAAWREIHIAEGSDWNWWYGPQNSSSCDAEFDRLYRKHLANVYELVKLPPKDNLKVPIMGRSAMPVRSARGFIKPVIDGLDTTYYEWLEAACFEVGSAGGTMHRAQSILKKICCGFDLKTLFIKIAFEIPESIEAKKENIKFVIAKLPPNEIRIEIPLFSKTQNPNGAIYKRRENGELELITDIGSIAYKKILELGVKFSEIRVKPGEDFKLAFFVEENGLTLERQPETGPIRLVSPTEDYEAYNWTA